MYYRTATTQLAWASSTTTCSGCARRREIADDGCVLVRPDRIIASRCPRGVSDPAGVLREAVTKILGR